MLNMPHSDSTCYMEIDDHVIKKLQANYSNSTMCPIQIIIKTRIHERGKEIENLEGDLLGCICEVVDHFNLIASAFNGFDIE